MRTWSWVLLCAGGWLGLVPAGCGMRHGESSVAAAANSAQPLGVSCLGRITPGEHIIQVSAPPQAIVKELRVHRGSEVRAGQELAILRDYDIAAAALAEAETDVGVAESTLVQAKAGEKPAALAVQEAAVRRQESVLRGASQDFERKQGLFQEHLLATADLDAARVALESARQGLKRENELLQSLTQVRSEDVQVAEKKLAAAQARKAYAVAALNQNRIVALQAGTVLEIHAYPGETVSSNGLLDLGDLSRMFVEAEVYISDLPRVRVGAAATVTGEGFAGALSGKVVEIMRQASDNRLYPPDVFTAADKRVLGVRIRLDDVTKVQHLSNSQVSVRIQP